MKQLLVGAVVCATVGIASFGAQSPQTQPPPSADLRREQRHRQLLGVPSGDAGLRTGDQHRARRRHQSRRAAVRSSRLA